MSVRPAVAPPCVLLAMLWLLIAGSSRRPPMPRLPSPAGWPLTGAPQVLRAFDPPTAPVRARVIAGSTWRRTAVTPVLAAAAGTVRFAGQVAGRGVVTVDHGSVADDVRAGRVRWSRVGQSVSVGAVLGRVSSGGHCGGRCLHWGLRQQETYLDPLLLLAGGNAGRLRLLAADQRSVAERLARQRVLAAAAARHVAEPTGPGQSGAVGPPGSHGFLHPVAGTGHIRVRPAVPSGAAGLEAARRHRLRRRLRHADPCPVRGDGRRARTTTPATGTG